MHAVRRRKCEDRCCPSLSALQSSFCDEYRTAPVTEFSFAVIRLVSQLQPYALTGKFAEINWDCRPSLFAGFRTDIRFQKSLTVGSHAQPPLAMLIMADVEHELSFAF